MDSLLKLPPHITAKTLFENAAKWHKDCRLRFVDKRVDQMIKLKKASEGDEAGDEFDDSSNVPKRPRRTEFQIDLCIFC